MTKKIQVFLTIITLCAFVAQGGSLKAMHGKVPGGYNFWLFDPNGNPGENSVEKGTTGMADMEEEAPDGYDSEWDEELREMEDVYFEDTPEELMGVNYFADSEAKPLIVFLHGASLRGNDLNKVKRYGSIYAAEHGRDIDAYIVAPQVSEGGWKPSKIMEVVDYVMAHNNIDPTRVYVLGMSLGGYGTLDFTASYPDRIAAAVAMCGGATVKNLDGLADVPLWIIHGTGDSAVPVSQSDKVVEAVRNAQDDGVNRLQYDRVPGMNHSKPARLFCNPDIYRWLFLHSLDTPGRPMAPTPTLDDEFFGNSYKGMKLSRSSSSSSASAAAPSAAASKASAGSRTAKKGASVKNSKKSKNAKSSKSTKKRAARKKRK